MIDSYQQFFSLIPQEAFFDFGIRNIIYADRAKSAKEWKTLRQKVYDQHGELYVRASGRNGAGNTFLTSLYKDIFGIDIKFDPTNNQKPTAVIQELTGHKKNKTIQKGAYVQEFQRLVAKQTCHLFQHEIEEYNHEMHQYKNEICHWVSSNVPLNLQDSIKKDFDPIEIHS